jgi:hypothetical protein
MSTGTSPGFTRRCLAGALMLGLGAWPSPASAIERVDLELVIATDVSYSIDEAEARLQREGVASAFMSRAVVQAVRSGPLRKIAVAYIDYSSRAYNRVIVDWRVIHDEGSAAAFSRALLAAPLGSGRHTSISDAVEFAAEMLATNGFDGTRRVIDVSGDGPNNFGRLVNHVRDEAVARGIAINGLPIMNENDRFNSRYYLPDLDRYYEGCVIGGPGAFIVVARDFKDFARAMRQKLVLEIAGRSPSSSVLPVQYLAPVYEKGCDIGERMRGGRFGYEQYEP